MNFNVDTKKLNNDIKMLDKYIKEYSDNSYEIFNNISKLSGYWMGKDASLFFDKINIEKKNNLLITDNLENMSNFFKEVVMYYDNFNKNGGK